MENMKMPVGMAKQPSVIEAELAVLRGRVSAVNDIARRIAGQLWVPAPEGKSLEINPATHTVSENIRNIYTVLEVALEKLDSIAKCLEEQLGDLKLES